MPHARPRDVVFSEGLLALASYWHKCADQSEEPWRIDMMRATAREFEAAAARVANQARAQSMAFNARR